MIVAVDFDGTIAKFDGWKGEEHIGDPIPGAKEALTKLKEQGHVIIVYTCRKRTDLVEKWLQEHGIPYDYVNENPVGPETHPSKLYADYYIDDSAVPFRGDWKEVLETVLAPLLTPTR